MRKWSGKRGVWWFAAASAVLHLGWFALLRQTPDARRERQSRVIELTFESLHAPAPLPPPHREPHRVEPDPPAPPPTPRVSRPERARERARPAELAEAPAPVEPSPLPHATGSEPPPAAPEVALQPPAAGSAPARPSVLDLSPRRAASTMIDEFEVARVCRPKPGAASGAACETEPPDGVVRGQRALNDALRTAANEPEYRVRREPPALRREGDGGYRYDGHVFSAKIRTDGHVVFFDGADVGVTGPATDFPGVKGGMDLTDMVEHGILGKERYSAEKRWFLEQTASLREQLTEAARASEAARARRALEQALERILAAAPLAPQQKRARVLELWEDCGEDGESLSTRRAIETFVRARMPEGSALGFSREELDRFNRARRGLSAFEPYRHG